MELHNYFRSSASFRIRIALEIKGLSDEYIPVRLAKGEHKKASYAAVLPAGVLGRAKVRALPAFQKAQPSACPDHEA